MARDKNTVTNEERRFVKALRKYAAMDGIYFDDVDTLVITKEPRVAHLQQMAKDFFREIPFFKPKGTMFVVSYSLPKEVSVLLNAKAQSLEQQITPGHPMLEYMDKLFSLEDTHRSLESGVSYVGLVMGLLSLPVSIRISFLQRKIKKRASFKLKKKSYFFTGTFKKAIHS